MYLYSALPHTQGAQAWITQCYLQLHQCLPLPRKRSPDGASPDWGCGHLIAAYHSFIYPERKGWVGLAGWPSADCLVVTRQLQVERRTGKVRRSKNNVLPLCHATNLLIKGELDTQFHKFVTKPSMDSLEGRRTAIRSVPHELPTTDLRNPLIPFCHERLSHQPNWRRRFSNPDLSEATLHFWSRAATTGSDTSPFHTTPGCAH